MEVFTDNAHLTN